MILVDGTTMYKETTDYLKRYVESLGFDDGLMFSIYFSTEFDLMFNDNNRHNVCKWYMQFMLPDYLWYDQFGRRGHVRKNKWQLDFGSGRGFLAGYYDETE